MRGAAVRPLLLLLAAAAAPALAAAAPARRGPAGGRVFLASRARLAQAPLFGEATARSSCFDDPADWSDTKGFTCEVYATSGYCTASGGYGDGWSALWGDFARYAAADHTANTACCACGGGRTRACDSDTCLEAEARAVKLVRDRADQLGADARGEIALFGQAAVANLTAEVRGRDGALIGQLLNASEHLRSQEVAAARERLEYLTQHKENLTDAAKHRIVLSSDLAARAAAAAEGGAVDRAALNESASQVAREFNEAAHVWSLARDFGVSAEIRGWREWREAGAEVNSTWETVAGSLRAVNRAAAVLAQPLAAARWSGQASRLAADLSELARTQATTIDQQVASAQLQADEAMRVTKANAASLAKLEWLAGGAERDAEVAARAVAAAGAGPADASDA